MPWTEPWVFPGNLLNSAGIDNGGKYSRHIVLPPGATGQIMVIATLAGSTDDFIADVLSSPYGSTQAVSATIQAAGVGYSVGDVLTVYDTDGQADAEFRVTSIGGPGDVTGIELYAQGEQTSWVGANPLNTTGGGGSGCTLNVTWQGNVWDTDPVATKTLTNDTSARTATFSLTGYRRLIVLSRSAGATDVHTVQVDSILGYAGR